MFPPNLVEACTKQVTLHIISQTAVKYNALFFNCQIWVTSAQVLALYCTKLLQYRLSI